MCLPPITKINDVLNSEYHRKYSWNSSRYSYKYDTPEYAGNGKSALLSVKFYSYKLSEMAKANIMKSMTLKNQI